MDLVYALRYNGELYSWTVFFEILFTIVVSIQWHISFGFSLSFALQRGTRELGGFLAITFVNFWNIIHYSRFNTIQWRISYGFSLSFALQWRPLHLSRWVTLASATQRLEPPYSSLEPLCYVSQCDGKGLNCRKRILKVQGVRVRIYTPKLHHLKQVICSIKRFIDLSID